MNFVMTFNFVAKKVGFSTNNELIKSSFPAELDGKSDSYSGNHCMPQSNKILLILECFSREGLKLAYSLIIV